jgi:hypothetical protein
MPSLPEMSATTEVRIRRDKDRPELETVTCRVRCPAESALCQLPNTRPPTFWQSTVLTKGLTVMILNRRSVVNTFSSTVQRL